MLVSRQSFRVFLVLCFDIQILKLPLGYQNWVLSYGIAGAVIFRLSLILLGTATLQDETLLAACSMEPVVLVDIATFQMLSFKSRKIIWRASFQKQEDHVVALKVLFKSQLTVPSGASASSKRYRDSSVVLHRVNMYKELQKLKYFNEKRAATCTEIDGIGFGHKSMFINKSRSHSASLRYEANATNYAAMIELVKQLYFFDPQDTAPPPRLNIHPLVDM
ncbi:hypothetical protein Tco_0272487 [Tanacetum coccineum]